MASSSRRRFLTGGSLLDATRDRANQVADALSEHALPRAGETVRLETRAMACPWAVILDPGPPERALTASHALDEVQRVERMLTVFRDDSETARVNREAADQPCAVTPELFELLHRCAAIHAATEGSFDPASQALIALWNACRSADRIPEQSEIDVALRSSGMTSVRWLPRSEQVPTDRIAFAFPGLGLNFGAIGKGYAIDRAADVLRTGGIADFVVHGGHSSLFAAGEHYGQDGWPIELKNPLFTDESYVLLLLRDAALGTSGSNIQFFRHGGRRYGHLLDPRTGWPADSLLSASVIAPSAAEADALSTAFYVLGLEKACEYCDTHPSIAAILTPPSTTGRTLRPVVCNLPAERVFKLSEGVELSFRGRLPVGDGMAPEGSGEPRVQRQP